MRFRIVLCLLILFGNYIVSVGQDQTDIMKPISNLFAAFESRDSTLAGNQFIKTAFLTDIKVNENGTVVSTTHNIDQFINFIGDKKRSDVAEPIWKPTIQVDDKIASVWVNYAFYNNGKLSHCGIDFFLLTLENDSWKIVTVTDTRRKQDCKVPKKLEKKYSKGNL